MIRTTKCN